jgi:hypothetical protein
MSRPANANVTRDNQPISAPSGGSVTRDCRTIRNGTVLTKAKIGTRASPLNTLYKYTYAAV